MKDADILYKTLRSNTFVIGLDLGYNTIGDDGAKLLGQLLQVHLHTCINTSTTENKGPTNLLTVSNGH